MSDRTMSTDAIRIGYVMGTSEPWTADRQDQLAAFDRWLAEERRKAKVEAVTDARKVISQYLATAEKWRYDRVMWAFAIMLSEIPEDTAEPLSPADEEEIARRETR